MIRYPGHCDDMAAAYQAADIVLMPSTVPEAFGRVAAEAQAMGKPVIVTDIGAVGETVRALPDVKSAEITGWRVAPDDPDALAAAIKQAVLMSDGGHPTIEGAKMIAAAILERLGPRLRGEVVSPPPAPPPGPPAAARRGG